ncbi:hypothetical protein WN48_01588 [Eufriesea mexicana]|nr:hypothetical protein WN48_01588 [Eufriesea mexicana]
MLRILTEEGTNEELSMGFIVTGNVSSRCLYPGEERGKQLEGYGNRFYCYAFLRRLIQLHGVFDLHEPY